MKLLFPFNNLVTNSLRAFLNEEFITNFIKVKSGEDFMDEAIILSEIEIYDSILPGLENEILQVIETTNQDTIDEYFRLAQVRTTMLTDDFKLENLKNLYRSQDDKDRFLEDFSEVTTEQYEKYMSIVQTHLNNAKSGAIKSKHDKNQLLKPVLFVEGKHDVKFLQKGAQLLDKTELLEKVEIRQRGGYSNLDKLWDVLKQDSWETIPQIKIFLYDCDTNKKDEEFGYLFKRIVPTMASRKITKGIENLFGDEFIGKAESIKSEFIDYRHEQGRERGNRFESKTYFINKDEKTNFCEWACENGTKEDFTDFSEVFEIIAKIVDSATTGNNV